MRETENTLFHDEVEALIRSASSRLGVWADRDAFLLRLGAGSGLRVGEMVNLRRSAFHLDGEYRFLEVRRLKRRKGPPIDKVLIDSDLATAARRYLRRSSSNGGAWLLPGQGGRGRLSKRQAERIFDRTAKEAGIKGRTIHSLRHYRGSALYDVSHDLEWVRAQLGHSSQKTTERYLHTSPARARDYLDRLRPRG